MRKLALFLALLTTAPALADSSLPPAYWANRQLPDAQKEAQAKALMEEIRCLVCQGESIADSDADLAGDMAGCSSGRLSYVVVAQGGVAGVGETLRRLPWAACSVDEDRVMTRIASEEFCALEALEPGHWPAH